MKNKSAKKLKGAEEIRKAMESVKYEVENGKNKSENEANEFLSDLDASIRKKISKIEKQKRELELEIKQNFNRAHNAGKSFVGNFKNHQKTIMYVFRFLLYAVFLATFAIFLVVFHINTFSISLLIFLAIMFFIFHRRIVKITKLSSKEMEDNINIFDTSPSLRDFEIPQKLQREKISRLAKLQNVLSGLLASVSKFIPEMDKTYQELTLLAKYEKKVKEFESTLEYFNIKLAGNLEKRAPADVRIIDDESYWEDRIVEEIASELRRDRRDISNDVIKLLYKEHSGQDTQSTFRTIKRENNKALKNLASLLFRSERLTNAPGALSYDVEDVSALLKRVEDFNLSQVNNLLSKTIRQLGYICSYKDYLEMDGIKVDFNPTLRFTLKKIDKQISSFEGQIIDLCYKFGLICFEKIITSKELSEGFARASVSIKFNGEVSLRKPACEISSDDIAVPVIRAFFEKEEQLGAGFATMKALVSDLNMVHKYIKRKNDWEHKFWKAQLKEGMWHDSTASLSKTFWEEKMKDIKKTMEEAHKYIVLKETVKQTFEQVKIVTIEKAIDAQVFSAYLILSHSSLGEFAPLIDKLSLRNLGVGISIEKRWEWKNKTIVKEIKNKYGVEPRYDFMKFSPSSWVGVLEKGESFTEFKNSFFSDLYKILEVRRKLQNFDIGLVIQRITPSKYSFGILEDVPDEVYTKDLGVARYVARLASDHITEVEQASLMAFDPDVDLLKILDTMSIFEMIRIKNDDMTNEEKRILRTPNLKDEVLEKLKIRFGVKTLTFKSLAIDLAISAINEQDVSSIITGALKSKLRRADVFSNRLVDVLKGLAMLYEIQRK